MANRVLTSGGDWSTAANWGGTKPVDGDNALISDVLPNDVTESADEGAIDTELIDIAAGYGGLFGTAASPIHLGTNILKIYGSSGAYFNLDDGGVLNTCTQVWINTPTGQVPVVLGQEAGAQAGSTYDIVKLAQGTLTIAATAKLAAAAALYVDGGGATAILAENGPTLPYLAQSTGRVFSNVAITEAYVNGGICTQDKAALVDVYVGPGAALDIRHTGTVATNVHLSRGATLILDGNTNVKVITNVYAQVGAIIQRNALIHTFTNFFNEAA